MNEKIVSAKNFVNRHKNKAVIATLAVTTAGTALMVRNQKQFNEFLKEHNLFDKYYALDED